MAPGPPRAGWGAGGLAANRPGVLKTRGVMFQIEPCRKVAPNETFYAYPFLSVVYGLRMHNVAMYKRERW